MVDIVFICHLSFCPVFLIYLFSNIVVLLDGL